MGDSQEGVPSSEDVQFEPLIQLPEVDVKSLEEDEEELLKLRAKLYRYVTSLANPPEWKERGTGFVKLLKHKEKGSFRLLMRRDKTLKVCANHNITPWMTLKSNCGSDRAWIWSVAADFADEAPTEEMLAIKFGTVENAEKFKAAFEECQMVALANNSEDDTKSDPGELTYKLDMLVLNDSQDSANAIAHDSGNIALNDNNECDSKESCVQLIKHEAPVDNLNESLKEGD